MSLLIVLAVGCCVALLDAAVQENHVTDLFSVRLCKEQSIAGHAVMEEKKNSDKFF